MDTGKCVHILILFFLAVTISGGASRTSKGLLLDFFLSPCKCRCGVPNREARLVGGEYLRGYEFPWAATLQILQGDSSVPATLINDRYLVTAASVIIGFTPLDVKITVGQFDRCFPDVSSLNMSVDKIIVHPDFSPGNRANDIALIKLSTPIKVERRVSPICLPVPNSEYLGQVATVTNWSENGTVEVTNSTCRPRKLGLPILGRTECLGAAVESQYVSNDKGCVGVLGLVSPICQTDAGAPVSFRSRHGIYELIGLLSDRNECGPTPSVALYTKINDHILFISRNTKDACFCLKT